MRKPLPTPVPQTRLGRIAQISLAAGEFAVGTAAEGLRRLARGDAGGLGSALFSAPNARRLAARLASLRGAEMSRVDARQPTVVDELRPWTMETDPGIE